ncbi:MAG: PPOX class F420-dependent oxidoreductase, partial [Proteobacteria bacterium]|nr:PPOX class F420-dependent oxidoreductase [Pseudomonadota bacterium]
MINASLAAAPYVNLATFRRDGRRVETPVWAAPDAQVLYVFSEARAGKVKRLKNSDTAEMAICTVNGKLLGDWFPLKGRVLNDSEIPAALRALHAKYGWKMRI